MSRHCADIADQALMTRNGHWCRVKHPGCEPISLIGTFSDVRFGDGEKAEEPAPPHPMFMQGPLSESCSRLHRQMGHRLEQPHSTCAANIDCLAALLSVRTGDVGLL